MPFNYLKDILKEEVISDETFTAIINNQVIKEALFFASYNLYSKLQKLNDFSKSKELESLKISILKYISRLSTRSTPFGLFAGISIGELSDENIIKLPLIEKNKRYLRLNMDFLKTLTDQLCNLQDIRKKIKFYPNSSIYEAGNKIRYIEQIKNKDKINHHVAAVKKTYYLDRILDTAENGIDIKHLTEELVDNEITAYEAEVFINELIENDILISELEPVATGEDYLTQIIKILSKYKIENPVLKEITEISDSVKSINSKPVPIDISEYEKLKNQIRSLNIDYDDTGIFHVDLYKPAENLTVNKNITGSIMQGINVLNRLSQRSNEINLIKFRNEFYERYGESEIPLLFALDKEIGIGYKSDKENIGISSPLTDNIDFPKEKRKSNISITGISQFLLAKYIDAVKNNEYEIVLTHEEIINNTDEPVWDDFPETLSVKVQIYKANDNIEILLQKAGGISATNLFSRFGYINEDISDFINEILNSEEKSNRNKITAEIVHNPKISIGNVLLRPVLRNYEIPYLAKPSVTGNHIIYPKDLMISVKENRLILKSKNLNKEILPRLSNAHNYVNSKLPVYQFLCDLQFQELQRGIKFNWGGIETAFKFFPRVKYKNIIFSPAKWRISKDEIEYIFKIDNDNKLSAEVKKWRYRKNIPVWVNFEEGENELTLNLENITSIKTFLSIAKKKQIFFLSEVLFNKKNAFIKENDDYFANEFIFAFKKNKS
ncbi:MAG: lantibiotic dehydratase family protein [Bacteroidales bacterium]|nr:lantibiotic dehydratase family protein [Bacteroidales bacterium]